jgi:hypothetical protein
MTKLATIIEAEAVENDSFCSTTTIAASPFLAAKFPHRQFNSAELHVLSGVGRTAFSMRGAKALSGGVRSHAGRKRELQL